MPNSSNKRSSRSVSQQVGRAYRAALGDVDMTFRATRQRAAVTRQIRVEPKSWRGLQALGMSVALLALLAVGLMGWRAQRNLDTPAAPATPAVAAKTIEAPPPPAQPAAEADVWIQAPSTQRADLPLGPFASGTLAAGGAARTRAHEPLGAEVWLETGSLQLQIEPGTGGHWTVHAGPYNVEVIGTVFSVTWPGPGSMLAVEVTRGEVRVTGGKLSPRGLAIVGGQRVEVTSSGQVARVLRAAAGGEDVRSARRPRTPKSRASGSKSTPTPTPRDAPQEWATLFAKGRYAKAYDAASRIGFDHLLRTSDAKTLHNLADVARLHGDLNLAERTLQRIRARYPGSRDAARAAFELGRIAADQRHAPTVARRWFERYLDERPHGTWARDARGRILRSLAREKNEMAQPAAAAYLRHHPDGPDAATARGILAQ